MKLDRPLILIRGGGDLASGVALRLHRCGFALVVTEIEQPLAVRRAVSFAEAVYAGETQVEELTGKLVQDPWSVVEALPSGVIPVLVDPEMAFLEDPHPLAVIDARMRKRPPENDMDSDRMTIGLGPGFTAGVDCSVVIETNRGHDLGRVIWEGVAEADTGVPEPVEGYDVDRVLRAPADGVLHDGLPIGALVDEGQRLAIVDQTPVIAPFGGALRGMLHDGLKVQPGMKIGDLDPRGIPEYCFRASDKSMAVAGGVLEALLSRAEIRKALGG